MNKVSIATLALLMTACRTAPVESIGGDEFVATLNPMKSATSADAAARLQASQRCSHMGGILLIPPEQPEKDKIHFRCVPPPPPPPAPPPPPPPPSPATAEELSVPLAAWRDCLIGVERSFDDMISDANTIASTLAGQCPTEWAAFQKLSDRGWSATVNAANRQHEADYRRGIARDVVLTMRAKRVNPAATLPPLPDPRHKGTL